MSGKILPEVMNLLEQRNFEGQTVLMTAIANNSEFCADFILDSYAVDLRAKDSIGGNSALHYACKN